MKLIRGMVRQDKMDDVRIALEKMNVRGIRVNKVQDFSPQRHAGGVWRGQVYTLDYTIKLEIQCVVHDDEADCAVRAILCAARTGCLGDGDVIVQPIEHRYNIHNGDRDAS
jgi:nitrogen regulatory protein P-II 1